jgi:hypothetical protein
MNDIINVNPLILIEINIYNANSQKICIYIFILYYSFLYISQMISANSENGVESSHNNLNFEESRYVWNIIN